MSRVEGHSGAERPETPGGFGVGPPATGNDDAAGNGEQVTFQEGDFYGSWITTQIVPFKGGPGTAGW